LFIEWGTCPAQLLQSHVKHEKKRNARRNGGDAKDAPSVSGWQVVYLLEQ
jgi:hypothetical protein